MSKRRQRNRNSPLPLWLAVVVMGIILIYNAFNPPNKPQNNPPAPSPAPSVTESREPAAFRTLETHFALGNPSNAVADSSQRENFLITRPQYTLSYNDKKRHANWVSWHLCARDLGNIERGRFQPDSSLPNGFYPVTPAAYTNSGYDRGHLCPSGDRTDTVENNNATFLMTNIFPQTGDNNQGPWRVLEDYCRSLTEHGNELYIIAGGSGKREVLSKGNVNVPKNTWKIVVILPEADGDDLKRMNRTTRVIAVLMPNVEGIKGNDWRRYQVSVERIERETGYRFLTNLPADVQSALKSAPSRE